MENIGLKAECSARNAWRRRRQPYIPGTYQAGPGCRARGQTCMMMRQNQTPTAALRPKKHSKVVALDLGDLVHGPIRRGKLHIVALATASYRHAGARSSCQPFAQRELRTRRPVVLSRSWMVPRSPLKAGNFCSPGPPEKPCAKTQPPVKYCPAAFNDHLRTRSEVLAKAHGRRTLHQARTGDSAESNETC